MRATILTTSLEAAVAVAKTLKNTFCLQVSNPLQCIVINDSLNMERVRKGFGYLAIGVLPLFPDALFAFLGSTPLSGEGGLTSKSGSVEK